MQVEQSTLAKIGKKEVDWSFSDLEEDGIYDMRLGMEGSFMFGVKRKFTHAKTVDHTHEGSIGNLMNEEIVKLMESTIEGFNFNRMMNAEHSLLCKE